MPLSPSFPDWLLKRDSTLAGALTNPIFLAFELRRNQRGSGRWAAFKANPTAPLVAITPILFLLVGLLANFIFPDSCCCFVIIGMIVSRVLSHIFQRSKSEVYWVPTQLRTAIEEAPFISVIRDLWMTPNGARVYAEALVLEGRMKGHLGAAVIPLICALGMGGIIFMAANRVGTATTLDAGDWVLLSVFSILAFISVPMVYWLLSLSQISDAKLRIKQAAGDEKLSYALWRASANAVATVFVLIAFLFLLGPAVNLLFGLFDALVIPVIKFLDFPVLGRRPVRLIHEVVVRDKQQFAIATASLYAIPISIAIALLAQRSFVRRHAALMLFAEEKLPLYFDRVLER